MDLLHRKEGQKTARAGESIFLQFYYIIFIITLTIIDSINADALYALREEIQINQDLVGAAVANERGLTPSETHIMCTPRSASAPTVPGALRFSSDSLSVGSKRAANVIDLATDSSAVPKAQSKLKSHFIQPAKKYRQAKMWSLPSDPAACIEMDVAIADFVLSRNYDFQLVEDQKFRRILDLARKLPPSYKPPPAKRVGGDLLCKLYDVNWQQETSRLLKDARTYGLSRYGDGATIKTFPKINACGSGVHNPFAMLEVFDCTKHMANGGVKDASYISGLFIPLIQKLEDTQDQFVSVLFVLSITIFVFP